MPNSSKNRKYPDMRSYLNIFGLILLVTFIIAGCKRTEENNPPVITSVTLTPMVINPDSITSVQVKATDNDGDLIVYTYYPSAGIIFGTGSNVYWQAPDTVGVYQLKIKAADGSGDFSMDSISLRVSEYTKPTLLKGTATFASGTVGDLSHSRIALYASVADWISDSYQKSIISGSGSFSALNFTMSGIAPGDYYMDVWKDNDNSLSHSNGDFLGWYGSGDLLNPQLAKVHITEGETTEINVQMYIYH
jgi:hypothetical protein